MKFDCFLRQLPLTLFTLCLFGLTHPALAQGANDVTFGVTATSPAPGQAIPTLTWNITGTGPTCTATGWAGINGVLTGSLLQPLVTKNTNYVLSCSWAADTTATLSWVGPTTNTDGTPLTDLAGFTVYWNTGDPSMVTAPTAKTRTIANPQAQGTVISNLPAGTWYFAVSPYNAQGVSGAIGGIPSKIIGAGNIIVRNVSVVFPGTAVVTVK